MTLPAEVSDDPLAPRFPHGTRTARIGDEFLDRGGEPLFVSFRDQQSFLLRTSCSGRTTSARGATSRDTTGSAVAMYSKIFSGDQ
jgi:hypothetical protein